MENVLNSGGFDPIPRLRARPKCQFQNSTEIMCSFLKTPEFGRSLKFWDLATALLPICPKFPFLRDAIKFLVMILPSPQLIVMSLANKDLQDDERSALAIALNNLRGQWGGGEFEVQEVNRPGQRFASCDQLWANGMPHVSSFVSVDSFLLFSLLGQQPEDLAWMEWPVSELESFPLYLKFEAYVESKNVVNNDAERFIGVTKPRVATFRSETNLQSNLLTTEGAKCLPAPRME